MSIKNLTTDNLKTDQNIKVNNLEAENLSITALTVNTLNSSNINNTGTVTTDSLTIDTQINLATTAYVDLPLQLYSQFTSDITFSIYGVDSAVLGNGLQLIRIGNIIVGSIAPFSIVGAGVGAATNTITSDVVIPDLFRPFNALLFVKSFSVVETVSNVASFLRYAGSGDFTFTVRKVNLANWTTGAISITNNYYLNFCYPTLPL